MTAAVIIFVSVAVGWGLAALSKRADGKRAIEGRQLLSVRDDNKKLEEENKKLRLQLGMPPHRRESPESEGQGDAAPALKLKSGDSLPKGGASLPKSGASLPMLLIMAGASLSMMRVAQETAAKTKKKAYNEDEGK